MINHHQSYPPKYKLICAENRILFSKLPCGYFVPCKTGLLRDLWLFVRVMNKLLENLHANICRFRSFRPPPYVSGYFWKRRVFLPFSKKIRLQKYRIRIVFGRPHENDKQRKYNSIPHRACVMLVVNDVLHHRIRKPPFSSSTRKQVASVFKKFHSGDCFRNDAF